VFVDVSTSVRERVVRASGSVVEVVVTGVVVTVVWTVTVERMYVEQKALAATLSVGFSRARRTLSWLQIVVAGMARTPKEKLSAV
jgi:hypothetical protein